MLRNSQVRRRVEWPWPWPIWVPQSGPYHNEGRIGMTTQARKGRKARAKWATMLVAIASAVVLSVLVSPAAAGTGEVSWFHVEMERGEAKGYHWAVGAKGLKHQPLSKICTQISMVEPPRDDVPYFEGRDATDCGFLVRPSDSIASTDSLGSGMARVAVTEVFYRPIVRKVTFILATGERRVFRRRIPRIPNRVARGIPIFRYLVAPFEGEVCIRRVVTFDGRARLVSSEGRPPCPTGAGNFRNDASSMKFPKSTRTRWR